MKHIAIITLAALFIGCGCSSNNVQLQPGDLVVFKGSSPAGVQDFERAAEFRTVTGNDTGRTGSIVTITVPTYIGANK